MKETAPKKVKDAIEAGVATRQEFLLIVDVARRVVALEEQRSA